MNSRCRLILDGNKVSGRLYVQNYKYAPRLITFPQHSQTSSSDDSDRAVVKKTLKGKLSSSSDSESTVVKKAIMKT